MNSLAQLNMSIADVEEANRTGGSRNMQSDPPEQDELLPDIEREEGEIFALEQILSEKRQLVRETKGLIRISAPPHEHDLNDKVPLLFFPPRK